MQSITALGGGSLEDNRAVIKESVLLNPIAEKKALLIPTATPGRVPDRIWNIFKEEFGDHWGYEVEMLDLLFKKYSARELKDLILNASLIYVSGGNTLRLVTVLKNRGVDKLLKQAFAKQIPIAGSSAGAICWHQYGHSDSRRENHPENWQYIRVAGLGYFPALFCPHYTATRSVDFEKMLLRTNTYGIACTDFAAIQYNANSYRVLKGRSTAKAYLFTKHKKTIIRRELKNKDFQPLASLSQGACN